MEKTHNVSNDFREPTRHQPELNRFWHHCWLPLAAAWIPFQLIPSLLMVVLGSGWWLRQRQAWQKDPLNGWIRIQISLLILVTVLANDWHLSAAGVFSYLPFLLFGMVFTQVFCQAEILLPFVQAVVGSSVVVIGLGWGQVLWGWQGRIALWGLTILESPPGDRPTGIFTSANTLAIYLVLILSLAAGLYLAGHSRRWLIGLFAIGVPLLGLTASRNGWAVAGLAVILFLACKRIWSGLVGIALVGSLIGGAVLDLPGSRILVPRILWQRLADTLDPQAAFFSSTSNRLDAWRFALQMIRERPWQGWGWQSFGRLYNAQDPPPPEALGHCHQLYLSLAAEGGLLVLGGFLLIWSVMIWRGWLAFRHASAEIQPLLLGVNVALLAYFTSGWLDIIFLDGRIHLLVWMLLGCANGSGLKSVQNQKVLGHEGQVS